MIVAIVFIIITFFLLIAVGVLYSKSRNGDKQGYSQTQQVEVA